MLTAQQIGAILSRNYPAREDVKANTFEGAIHYLARAIVALCEFDTHALAHLHNRLVDVQNRLVALEGAALTATMTRPGGGVPTATGPVDVTARVSPGTAAGREDPIGDAAWVMGGIDPSIGGGVPSMAPQPIPMPPQAPGAPPPSAPTAGGNPVPPDIQAMFMTQAAKQQPAAPPFPFPTGGPNGQ